MCPLPGLPRDQWPKMGSEALLKVFKAFSHLQCPLLTVSYMSFLLKHGRLPKQYTRYDKFLGILWQKHHFYAAIINLEAGHIVTFDGLNHSKIKGHNINKVYRKIAHIFKIDRIINVVLKKPQNASCNLCLPLTGTFFLHYLGYRFNLDMVHHLLETKTPIKCIRKAKQKSKSICKTRTFVISPNPNPLSIT